MIAIYQYFGFELPIKERFDLIKSAGFDAVGLWRDDWFGWTGHREFPDIARAAGLHVIDGHAPFARDYDFVNAIWEDNLDGETTYETYLRSINECGEDGITNLMVHLNDNFGGSVAPPPNELGVLRLNKLVEAAEKQGVTIALENIDDQRYLSYVFERISSPNLGFCYDVAHWYCNERNADFLSLYGNKLAALHLHDNDGSDDQHRIPFEGGINWQEQMSRIAATDYSGPTTVECTNGPPGSAVPGGIKTAEEWLHKAYSAAKRLDEMRRGS